jgi:hypothetical protein
VEINRNYDQVVDPEISLIKFNEQVSKFRLVEKAYRAKGIVCLKSDYPNIDLLFCANKIVPAVVGFAIRINFSNYDLEPPSVTFIDLYTEEPILERNKIPFAFLQFANPFQPQDLVQGGGTMLPFLCIPGIREYHNHPAHSGDSWFLYRKTGEGTLLFILDQLYNHSLATVKGYLIQYVSPKAQLNQEFLIQQQIKIT